MSTRDMAYSIIEHLNEEQLKAFVELFKSFYPNIDSEQAERDSAFKRLESRRRPGTHDIDEKKELEEYRREKYGV